MTSKQPYRILLYYKFVPVPNPEELTQEHLAFCKELGLRGRVLIAPEGINGTVSGTIEQTNRYITYMNEHPLFKGITFKIDPHDRHAFRKMFVRQKKELVTFCTEKPASPLVKTGKYLSPKEFMEHLQRDDVIVLDGRNNYEYDVGHFRNAIRPDVKTFREFPEWIRKNMKQYKDRKIITYCTGGIRCEKLTSFMLQEGFSDVAQLEGGIVTYGRDPEVQGQYFDGKCYVFDERMIVPINQVEEVVVGRCVHCQSPSERIINCQFDPCHKQHICCEECEQKHQGYCSETCSQAAQEIQQEAVAKS